MEEIEGSNPSGSTTVRYRSKTVSFFIKIARYDNTGFFGFRQAVVAVQTPEFTLAAGKLLFPSSYEVSVKP